MKDRIQISSDTTLLYRIFGTIFYPIIFIFISIIMIKNLNSDDTMFILMLAFYICFNIFSYYFFRFIWLLADVEIDDTFLYVSRLFKKDKVRLDQIQLVKKEFAAFNSYVLSEPIIRVQFKIKTIVGKTILVKPSGSVLSPKTSMPLKIIDLLNERISHIK